MIDIAVLREQIQNGGDSDLYRGILKLDPNFRKGREINTVFLDVAKTVVELFPDRIETDLVTSYDARIILMECSQHSATTRDDILSVLRNRLTH